MRLEDHLVRNRYLLHLLGARNFEELKALLRPLQEGPDPNGQSYFLGALLGLKGQIPPDELQFLDRCVIAYEDRLRKARKDFTAFRYFQYLSVLFTEIYLSRLTNDPNRFLADLNGWLKTFKRDHPAAGNLSNFTAEELRRLAFFMATGSGKTLLMHVNIWQVLHYLQQGKHLEALLPRRRGTRDFANIILITPNEGLSAQHIAELRASGFDAVEFIAQPNAKGTAEKPLVKVIEIHKLAETPSKGGVSLVMSSIGQENLVIVDEGHKGTGSEAQSWKTRQKYLSNQGFLLEYSATFAQAISAAGPKAKTQLLQEYGKAILFDYSYAHFYGDGYGKDFRVLNLRQGGAPQAHELLVGGLLTFYHQFYLYQSNQAAYRPYHLEKPLWVLLGSSVKATYSRGKTKQSDVAEVVGFLRRFVEEPTWAVAVMAKILAGSSGYIDATSGQDLFAPHIPRLQGQNAQTLYEQIVLQVFRGSGGLEAWHIKNADGEFGLRLSQADEAAPYFGVVNIGDAAEFKKYLSERVGLEVKEDAFRPSQFDAVAQPDSPISMLIGAKKFIEGWSSWRVSSMGLLNVGKGEGSQIIQLFGRGVRLKGKGMSLKRSAAFPGESHPADIGFLETLAIFGWNADYIEAFEEMLKAEELPQEVTFPVANISPWPEKLPLPEPKPAFDPRALTWTLDANGPAVALDRTPKVVAVATQGSGKAATQASGTLSGKMTIDFSRSEYLSLLDLQRLYHDVLEYKRLRNYDNVFIPPAVLTEILEKRATLHMLPSDLSPETLHSAASDLLKSYLDRFVRLKEREAAAQNMQIGYLQSGDRRIQSEYRLRVRGGEQVLAQIQQIINAGVSNTAVYAHVLPRLYWDRSLFNPLLLHGHDETIDIVPSPLNKDERQLVIDLQTFWAQNHNQPPYNQYEIYLLRNLPLSGIGLFHRAGFYPDFVLWRKNTDNGWTRVIFLDPHGLHHGGLEGSADKFAALEHLKSLSQQKEFQQAQIELDGYILTTTPVQDIPDAKNQTVQQLQENHPLLWMTQNGYLAQIL